MNKNQFLNNLKKELKTFDKKDLQKFLAFYSEMIDDKIEDGMNEDQAVNSIGLPSEIASQIKSENYPNNEVLNKGKKQRKTWEIILIIVGSPIWLSLIISFFAVVISICLSLWAVLISLYAVSISIGICSLAGIFLFVFYIIKNALPQGLVFLGAGIFLLGLSPILIFACNKLCKLFIKLNYTTLIAFKNLFIKKEQAL